MEETKKTESQNSSTGGGCEHGGGCAFSRRWKGVLSLLAAAVVGACVYALVTERDIPDAMASVLSVLVHAIMGM